MYTFDKEPLHPHCSDKRADIHGPAHTDLTNQHAPRVQTKVLVDRLCRRVFWPVGIPKAIGTYSS